MLKEGIFHLLLIKANLSLAPILALSEIEHHLILHIDILLDNHYFLEDLYKFNVIVISMIIFGGLVTSY